MDLSYSKRSTCKSVTDFSINSLKSKLHVEVMQKNLNPSRSRNIILAKSSSLMNVKIKIKTDNKIFDRLMYTTNFLKKTHSTLKNVAKSEEKKHKIIDKTTLDLNNEFGNKWWEKKDIEDKLSIIHKEKRLVEKKYQSKVKSTNMIVNLCNNMYETINNISENINVMKKNIAEGKKYGDSVTLELEKNNNELLEILSNIRDSSNGTQKKIDDLYIMREKLKTDIKNDLIICDEKQKLYLSNTIDLKKKIEELKLNSYFYQINFDKNQVHKKVNSLDKVQNINKELEEKINNVNKNNENLRLKISGLKEKIYILERTLLENPSFKRRKTRFKRENSSILVHKNSDKILERKSTVNFNDQNT